MLRFLLRLVYMLTEQQSKFEYGWVRWNDCSVPLPMAMKAAGDRYPPLFAVSRTMHKLCTAAWYQPRKMTR